MPKLMRVSQSEKEHSWLRWFNVRTKDGAVYRRTNRHLKQPIHYAGDVLRMAAPGALRYEIPSEPQLPVTRRPTIPTVSPNQLAEVPAADFPVVPSEVNNLTLRSRYGRIYINRLSELRTLNFAIIIKRVCETLYCFVFTVAE